MVKVKRARKSARGTTRRKVKATPAKRTAGSRDDARQTYIKGTEPAVIPELTAMVERYIKLRKQQQAAKLSADEERGRIRDRMEEAKLDVYQCSSGDVVLEHGVTVVKIKLARE